MDITEKIEKYLRESKSPDKKLKPVRFEVGEKLSPSEKKELLKQVGDVYKEGNAPLEDKGVDQRGDVIVGYAYTPELFLKSDITGKPIRFYVKLPDGRIAHPSELYPNIRKEQINKELERRAAEENREEYLKNQRLKRISDTKSEANMIHKKRNRPLKGSYLAKNKQGKFVRVDGTDKEDVKFFKKMGFEQITEPIE